MSGDPSAPAPEEKAERQQLTGILGWLDERIDIEALTKVLRKKEVPLHRYSGWYYWGGITLLFFIVQLFTGLLLLVYYQPGSETAHNSVQKITSEVEFGWLIRSVHSWSANLMLLGAFVHMFSVYFMKAYRRPRELTWFTGVALLGLGMLFGFSGYLLPWDQLAYFGTVIGLDVSNKAPVLGPIIGDLLRGGKDVAGPTLQRFFALHVAVLPVLFMPILMLHLWLVQKHGNAVPPSVAGPDGKSAQTMPFFPNFLYKDLVAWLLCLNVLAVLASLFPWELGPAYDPTAAAPEGIHPEWYFMSQFQLLKVIPHHVLGIDGKLVGMGLFTAGGALWATVPLWDRETKSGRARRMVNYIGIMAVFVLLGLTMWGYADL